VRCPDENVLAGYVDGGLGRDQHAAIDRHIDGCEACRTIVSDLARIQAGVHEDEDSMARTFAAGVDTLDVGPSVRALHIVPGTMVGEYEVTDRIGAGGMGAVFAAIHPRIHKKAAIKVLRRDLARDPTELVRFENEARAVNAIGHPNLVDIFAFGEMPDGNPFFVMEHVDGESLDRWLKQRGAVPLDVAMPILRQVFDALSAVHDRGIIHRDLKPGNIMIAETPNGPRIKILDFGLAKVVSGHVADMELTNPGATIGTPYFMSPEQFMGHPVDQRTDIYALGVLVYHMLCGQYPIIGSTPTEVGINHVNAAPVLPSSIVPRLPRSVDAVIGKALAKNPADRFATVRELAAGLEQCLLDTAPVPKVEPVVQARPKRAWMIGGAVAALTGAAISFWAISGRASQRAAPAPQPTSVTMPSLPIDAAVAEPPKPAEAPNQPAIEAKEPAIEAKEPAVEAKATTHTPKPTRPKPRNPVDAKPVDSKPTPVDDDRMLLEGGSVKKGSQ